jgi:5-methyltetrahydropteroyltriglutamate--homocysteine methyltransferase
VHRARPRYTGKTAVERDIANLKAALKGKSVVDVFMPAVSPGQIFPYHVNRHYKSDEEFLIAIGEAWARMPE